MPERAKMLLQMAQKEVNDRWQLYDRMSKIYEKEPEELQQKFKKYG